MKQFLELVVYFCAAGFVGLFAHAAYCEVRVMLDKRRVDREAAAKKKWADGMAEIEREIVGRARVTKVGTLVDQPHGGVYIEGWNFDCTGQNTPISHLLPNGKFLFCGYTCEELREIHRRPAEFVEAAE